MSKIAQELFREIEAPVTNITPRDYKKIYRNACNYDNKTKRSVVVEEQQSIIARDGSARIKFRTEETVLDKTCIDSAVNTYVTTGKLDSNDALFRRRPINKCACKPSVRYPPGRVSTKQIQTFDAKLYSFSDKACFHCAETSTCGTQFRCASPKPRSQDRLSGGGSRKNLKIVIQPTNKTRLLPANVNKRDSLRRSDDGTKTVLRPPEQRKSEAEPSLTQSEESETDISLDQIETTITGSRFKHDYDMTRLQERKKKQQDLAKSSYRLSHAEVKKSNHKLELTENKSSDYRSRQQEVKKSNYRHEETENKRSDYKSRQAEDKKSSNSSRLLEQPGNKRGEVSLRQSDVKKSDYRYNQNESKNFDTRLREQEPRNSDYSRPEVRKPEVKALEPRKTVSRQPDHKKSDLIQPDATRPEYKKPEAQKAHLDLRLTNLVRSERRQEDIDRSSSRIPSVNFMGARRWSLSQYTTRGPDF